MLDAVTKPARSRAGSQRLHVRTGVVAMAALLLAACSTTPLPPWPPETPAKSQPPGAPVAAIPVVGAHGISQAVQARFPDPIGVHYETPGLQEGRTTFTSNPELLQFLNNLTVSPAAGVSAQVVISGKSQLGADIPVLLVAKGVKMDSLGFAASGKPTVLLVAEQHGNSPAGAEALLVVARMLTNGQWSSLLDHINVVIMPRANPDGAASGSPLLADGIDLDSDHLLLRTPEARAMARIEREYAPMVVVDSEEYPATGVFEQKFQHLMSYDAMLQYANTPNIGEFIIKAANEWFAQPVFQALAANNLTSQWYFTTSPNMQDMSVSMGSLRPASWRNVSGLRNAISLQIESRGAGLGRAHIQRRVQTQVVAIHSVLQQAGLRADALKQVQAYVEREAASQACKGSLVINAAQEPGQRQITMLDPTTGLNVVQNLNWNSALEIRPTLTRERPCGYLISSSESDVISRLQMLGVSVWRVAEPGTVEAQRYVQAAQLPAPVRPAGVPAGAASPMDVTVRLVPDRVDVPTGSFYVPMGQSLAYLAAAALEPDTPSSYFANHVQHSLGTVVRVTTPPSLVFEELN